jgi:hypothetical protein
VDPDHACPERQGLAHHLQTFTGSC